MPSIRTEQDLCAVATEKLEAEGWVIYSEVPVVLDGRERTIDIVACKDGLIQIVEAKLALSNVLVEQARRWIDHVDYVSVLLPEPRQMSLTGPHEGRRIRLRSYGIGVLYVRHQDGRLMDWYHPGGEPTMAIRPRRQFQCDHSLILSSLCDRQSGSGALPAGTAAGKRARPDQYDEIRQLLENQGRATLGWLRAMSEHHPKPWWNEFRRKAERGEIHGIEVDLKIVPAEYRRTGT